MENVVGCFVVVMWVTHSCCTQGWWHPETDTSAWLVWMVWTTHLIIIPYRYVMMWH